MFEKIKKHFTFCLSTLALLNASAFSGYLMSQTELEEIVSCTNHMLVGERREVGAPQLNKTACFRH